MAVQQIIQYLCTISVNHRIGEVIAESKGYFSQKAINKSCLVP
jgi:hypothetical protein